MSCVVPFAPQPATLQLSYTEDMALTSTVPEFEPRLGRWTVYVPTPVRVTVLTLANGWAEFHWYWAGGVVVPEPSPAVATNALPVGLIGAAPAGAAATSTGGTAAAQASSAAP